MAYYRKRCKCGKDKWAKCKHTWSFTMDGEPDPLTGKARDQITRSGYQRKQDAIDEVARLTHNMAIGKVARESGITLHDFSFDWLKIYRDSAGVKYPTFKVRRGQVKRLLKYFPEDKKLKDVSTRDYQLAINKMTKDYEHNTVLGTHNCANMIFEKAIEYKMINENPTEHVSIAQKKLTVEELESGVELPKYLEKDELALLLKTAEEDGLDQNYLIFLTLAYTGLRVGELCILKWRDIDFKEKTISITKTYTLKEKDDEEQKGGYGLKDYAIATPKNKKSVRVIVVDDLVLAELERHQAYQRKLKMRTRKNYHDEDFIFIYTDEEYPGYPIKPVKIDTHMHRLLVLAGLNPTLTPHSLRHTHTSLLAEAGVSLEDIMDRLGHANDNTTRSVYLHVTKPKKKEAARLFGELMQSTRK